MTAPASSIRLLIVGNPDPVHVGSHLHTAARSLQIDARLCDMRGAYDAPAWRQKTDWWMRGRRPARLPEFSARVLQAVRSFAPDVVLATGPNSAPVCSRRCAALRRMSCSRPAWRR